MAKKKNDSNALVAVITGFLELIIILILKIIFVSIDFIRIYASGYKKKSGNGFFKTYFNKGNYGEFKLYRKLIRLFGKSNVYTNLYLDNTNTELTEVDVVAVSTKGVYVFEMKNYSGYIYGSSKDDMWTQVLNRNNKYKFYNPLKQNYAHTKAIENYLGINSNQVIPMVIFSYRAKLKKLNIFDNQTVITFKELKKEIKKTNKLNDTLTQKDVKEIGIKFIEKSNMSDEVKKSHIKSIEELKKV